MEEGSSEIWIGKKFGELGNEGWSLEIGIGIGNWERRVGGMSLEIWIEFGELGNGSWSLEIGIGI